MWIIRQTQIYQLSGSRVDQIIRYLLQSSCQDRLLRPSLVSADLVQFAPQLATNNESALRRIHPFKELPSYWISIGFEYVASQVRVEDGTHAHSPRERRVSSMKNRR